MNAEVGALLGSPYQDYLYAYPHKTAYRRLDPPWPLARAWADEPRDALFAYLHVPFCQIRCGFCNLFTASRPEGDLVEAWLSALARQTKQVASAIGPARYARVAIGGGTPTFLEPAQLERVLDLLEGTLGAELQAVPVGVEVSPETATEARLSLLRTRGVDRVSIGVQSFAEAETRAVLRPQRADTVEAALDRIRDQGFPVLNLDLIYGIDGQTPASWAASLERALRWAPEEIYLYPLYVRPLTGLSLRGRQWDDQRLALYRLGRDLLRAAGYRQVSMRMFRREDAEELAGPAYRCQEDGMVGLGCGARSYTRRLHTSTEYAVASGGVREIIAAYARKSDAELAVADWGFELDASEQRRRWLILTLLADGVSRAEWRARFGEALDAAELAPLVALGLAHDDGERVRLTEAGVERSDAVGPWLVTPAVRARMDAWELR